MNWLIGILVAPRPVPTIDVTLKSLRESWSELPYVFAEPGCSDAIEWNDCLPVIRSRLNQGETEFERSPSGGFGNFQNWLQSGLDLSRISGVVDFTDSDAIMICEDDAQFTSGIREYVESFLWPSEECGVVSLYAPKMSQYRSSRVGIAQTHVVHSGEQLTAVNNLVGALALVFPRKVLAELVNHPSQHDWKGSHKQIAEGCKPWERKAVDTWVGRTLLEMGRTCWHFTPSLVNHYAPRGAGRNSSLGHGGGSSREAKGWSETLPKSRVLNPYDRVESVR